LLLHDAKRQVNSKTDERASKILLFLLKNIKYI